MVYDIGSIDVQTINTMSYTDFVGLVNQWNVLPGSYSTLSTRAQFAKISEQSHLLEIACTTGFSIREISTLTGCSGHGIDISEKSIEMAKYNQSVYGKSDKVIYEHIDAYNFFSDRKFTHIIVGAALKFFPDQPKIIAKITDLLVDGGYLLASPFYVEGTIPEELIEKARSVFGITITTNSYKEIMDLYNKFEIIYEERKDLLQETQNEIAYYVKCTIDRITNQGNLCTKQVYDALSHRLMTIKLMSNELRPYQKYTILTLRYRSNIYPNRFVELF